MGKSGRATRRASSSAVTLSGIGHRRRSRSPAADRRAGAASGISSEAYRAPGFAVEAPLRVAAVRLAESGLVADRSMTVRRYHAVRDWNCMGRRAWSCRCGVRLLARRQAVGLDRPNCCRSVRDRCRVLGRRRDRSGNRRGTAGVAPLRSSTCPPATEKCEPGARDRLMPREAAIYNRRYPH